MALLRLAQAEVVSAHVALPRTGVWTADLDLVGDVPSGTTTLQIGALTLRGTVRRAGTSRGSVRVQLVGGAGRLGERVEAKAYRYVPIRIPVTDTLNAVGETLAGSSDASILSHQLTHWVRMESVAGIALSALTETWRMLPSGEVWVGTDKFAEASLAGEHVVVQDSPSLGRTLYAVDAPELLPGTSLNGRRIDAVEHFVDAKGARSVVWWQR